MVGSEPPPNGALAPSEVSHLVVLNHDARGDEVREMFESGGGPVAQ
jgi:hypothetical protein